METKEIIIEEQNSEQVDDVECVDLRDPYGFIYITTNLVNGKRYLGRRKFTEKWDNYLGSGTAFKRALKKYKRHNFRRNIIAICYSDEELNRAEYELSVFFDAVRSKDWYNIVYGGSTTTGLHHSNETKQKLRDINLGKKMPEETKKKIGKKLSEVLTGRTFTKEHRQHIRESRTGLKNPGCRTVYCIELDEIFWSAKAAEEKYKIDNGSICKCCRGLRKTIGKHPVNGLQLQWKYIDDFVKNDGTIIQGAVTLGYVTEEEVNEYLNNLKQKEIDTNG